jgi:hypothetical protein
MQGSASLRPIGMPLPVEVRVDSSGMPNSVTRRDARGRRTCELRVDSVEEVWRLAEAWWREPAQARTYYRVILEGRPLTVYHDDVTGNWFEQPYTEPSDR